MTNERNQTDGEYTCPYCKWSPSHDWSNVRQEKERIDRKNIGYDLENTYFLETNKVFNVKICPKCDKYLKIRSTIYTTLFSACIICTAVALIAIAIGWIFEAAIIDRITNYAAAGVVGFGLALAIFWLLWQLLGPARAHVKYKRARTCNALVTMN